MTYEKIFIAKYGKVIAIEGDSELVFACPECGKKLRANIIRGVVNCFNCGFGKGVKFDGAHSEIEKRQYNTELQNKVARAILETDSLSYYHEKYLEERGVFDPKSFGIRTVPFDIDVMIRDICKDAAVDSGLLYPNGSVVGVLNPRRIFVPYWYGGDLVGFKTRTNPYDEQAYGLPRYLNPPSTRVPRYPMWLTKRVSDIVITEGEFKNIVTWLGGWETYSVSGISVTKQCERKLIELLRGRPGRRFLILDREKEGPEHLGVMRATKRLCRSLQACPVILPGTEGQKTGVDDFILDQGYKALEDLLEEAWSRREPTINWLNNRFK